MRRFGDYRAAERIAPGQYSALSIDINLFLALLLPLRSTTTNKTHIAVRAKPKRALGVDRKYIPPRSLRVKAQSRLVSADQPEARLIVTSRGRTHASRPIRRKNAVTRKPEPVLSRYTTTY